MGMVGEQTECVDWMRENNTTCEYEESHRDKTIAVERYQIDVRCQTGFGKSSAGQKTIGRAEQKDDDHARALLHALCIAILLA